MPVTKQPLQWANRPAPGNCAPGLEYFTGRPQIHLKQKIDVLESLIGWEQNNKFRITDPITGDVIGMFKEDSEVCHRQCCKNMREFKAQVLDAQGQIIFQLFRPFKCSCCNGFCCAGSADGCCGAQQMDVMDSNGAVIGRIQQQDGCHGLGYLGCACCIDWNIELSDARGHVRYTMRNDLCSLQCGCDDKLLPIFDNSNNQTGKMTKKWRGCVTECCTIADALLIDFPADADESMKAVITAACLLSDYNIWEKEG